MHESLSTEQLFNVLVTMKGVARALGGIVLGLLFAPLLGGLINWVKAFYAGRVGRSVFQNYYDLARLMRKGVVYSTTSSWLLRAGPIVNLACVLTALAMVPLAGAMGIFSFSGDFIFLAGVLALGRFAVMLAALDTGSAFCGMGASREATYGALAEPAFFLCMSAAACETGHLAMSGIFKATTLELMGLAPLVLIVGALMILMLLETSRFPFDDADTHLELTMIHEAMVLDLAGPDLLAIEYASMLKMWVMSAIVCGLALPIGGMTWYAALGWTLAGQSVLACGIGVLESNMARLRLLRVPQLIAAASIMGMLALFLILRPV